MPNILSETLQNLRREVAEMQQDLDTILDLVEPEPELEDEFSRWVTADGPDSGRVSAA